jgi:lactose/L-arabinose transport system substrate-binding protein
MESEANSTIFAYSDVRSIITDGFIGACNAVRKLIPKIIVALCLLAVIGFVSWLPRVGALSLDTNKTQIEIWSWNVAALALKSLTPPFEQQHPKVSIYINMSGADPGARFLLALASGVGAPDVVQLQATEAERYTPTERLTDLTALAGKYEKDFVPAFWQSCVHDGKVYAIPWDIGPCAVFYKRWIFEKYGINPDTIETWDDFIEAGKQIDEKSNHHTRMLPVSITSVSNFFLLLMQQNGGGIFDSEGRIILNSPQNREDLRIVRKMLDAGITSSVADFSADFYATFSTDTIACYPAAVWSMQQIKTYASKESPGNWGVFRLPAFRKGGLRNSNYGGSVLVIPKQSRSSEQAWKFMEFANCTVAGQVRQFRESALYPAYLPALKDPVFDEPDPFFAGQKVNRLFSLDIERVPPLVRTKDWNEATSYLAQTMSDWASDKMDDETYLQSAAEALGRRLSRSVVKPADTGERP